MCVLNCAKFIVKRRVKGAEREQSKGCTTCDYTYLICRDTQNSYITLNRWIWNSQSWQRAHPACICRPQLWPLTIVGTHAEHEFSISPWSLSFFSLQIFASIMKEASSFAISTVINNIKHILQNVHIKVNFWSFLLTIFKIFGIFIK